MLRLSINCANMGDIMWIPMLKSVITSVGFLNTKLKEHLNLVRVDSYNELVNMAITQEDCIMVHKMEKKRKAPAGPSSALPRRYRIVQNIPVAPSQKAPRQGRWIVRPPPQQQQNRSFPLQ